MGVFICIKVCVCWPPTFYSIPLPRHPSSSSPPDNHQIVLLCLDPEKHLLSVFKVGRVSDPFNLGSLCWFFWCDSGAFFWCDSGHCGIVQTHPGLFPHDAWVRSFWDEGWGNQEVNQHGCLTSHVGCIDLPPQRTSSCPWGGQCPYLKMPELPPALLLNQTFYKICASS